MSEQNSGPDLSEGMHSLLNSSKSSSEAFSIIGMELIELKAMLMALIDLQKSSLMASGVNESMLETNVRDLIEGYRRRYLDAMSSRIKDAAQD